jgi:hypothetical protein
MGQPTDALPHQWQGGLYQHFKELIEIATSEHVEIVEPNSTLIDLEITGPYTPLSDEIKTPLIKKVLRGGYVTFTKGKHLSRRDLAVGVQPSVNAKKSIWFTGENIRPPQGTWHGYFSFDTDLPSDRSVYFPAWFWTSTNLFNSTKKTYWGNDVPTIDQLLQGRTFDQKKKKFCASFIGKTYPMRLHALEALSRIKPVDVYGSSTRKIVQNPYVTANLYNYILCFENDIYPGYVTEKPFEAYISKAIPLYNGFDKLNYLNPKAIVNLFDFSDLLSWSEYVMEVDNDIFLYKSIYEQPLLIKRPSLDSALILIRSLFK